MAKLSFDRVADPIRYDPDFLYLWANATESKYDRIRFSFTRTEILEDELGLKREKGGVCTAEELIEFAESHRSLIEKACERAVERDPDTDHVELKPEDFQSK